MPRRARLEPGYARPDHAGLRLVVAENYARLSRNAAQLISAELQRKPDLLICASAGGTPTGAYTALADLGKRKPQLFRRLRVLQIDEWLGLCPAHSATCQADLRRKLIDPLGLPATRFIRFTSHTADPQAECARIRRWLAAHGPIDLCILGLGLNGHIAMNEPAAQLVPGVHRARLAPGSRQHPLLQRVSPKPRFGLTLGLGDILRSRKILLLVSGESKRAALNQLLNQRISTRFPASFLWLHPDATILCDRASFPHER